MAAPGLPEALGFADVSFVSGVLATVIGLRATIFVGAVGASFSFLFIALSPLRTIREMPDTQHEVAEPADA